jgi:hypothetical protein
MESSEESESSFVAFMCFVSLQPSRGYYVAWRQNITPAARHSFECRIDGGVRVIATFQYKCRTAGALATGTDG